MGYHRFYSIEVLIRKSPRQPKKNQCEIPPFNSAQPSNDDNTSLPPPPIKSDDEQPGLEQAIEIVKKMHGNLLCNCSLSVFIVQWETNAKANQISKLAAKTTTEKNAEKSARVHFKDSDKVEAEVDRRKEAATSEQRKRKQQPENDKGAAELKELKKRQKSL